MSEPPSRVPAPTPMKPPLLILDACAVINLYATREMERILVANAGTHTICDVVQNEAQYVRRGGQGQDARDLERIDLDPLLRAGTLTVLSASNEEEFGSFIDMVGLGLHEGEAMSGAIALHRDGIVVTDDRPATARLQQTGVKTTSALELVKRWTEGERVTGDMLADVLVCIRERARYVPAISHPLRNWWDVALQRCSP